MLISVTDLANRWGISPRTVLHVGAHEAEEMAAYESHGWGNERTIWIEGQLELAEHLTDRIAGRAHHRVVHAVAWDAVETVAFYRTNNSQSSSALPLKLHSVEYPSVTVEDVYRVETSRLDDILAEDLILQIGVDFLNLDIQGAELRAMRGLGTELSRVRAVYSEVNLAELYEGCATLREVDSYLDQHGFALVDIRLTRRRWGDALWVPKTSITFYQRLRCRILAEMRIAIAILQSMVVRGRRIARKAYRMRILSH